MIIVERPPQLMGQKKPHLAKRNGLWRCAGQRDLPTLPELVGWGITPAAAYGDYIRWRQHSLERRLRIW